MGRPKSPVKRVPKTLWLDPDVLESLSKTARESDLSMSETANTLLRKVVVSRELEATGELVVKRLEQLIRRTLTASQERLIYLTAQAALEAGTTRQVLFNHLREAHLDGGKKALAWNKDARKHFVQRLRESPDELFQTLLELRGQGEVKDGEG